MHWQVKFLVPVIKKKKEKKVNKKRKKEEVNFLSNIVLTLTVGRFPKVHLPLISVNFKIICYLPKLFNK